MKKTQTVIRIILGVIMCVLIYKEAGIFTSIFAGVMLLYTEINSIHLQIIEDYIFKSDRNIPLTNEEKEKIIKEYFKAQGEMKS